eukprot:TRINITY_DN4874_c0_g1_i1.p3 TRINITY_DN4874_c0_g1~~TRINITY_DN4874_c0_g1_i1.p3  ORF type:complete len:131 (+),score=46.43 TRINITY_DN4874_c0_g1_i1:53-445(+)
MVLFFGLSGLFFFFFFFFFFFSSRRRHTRCREVSWARRCVQETGLGVNSLGFQEEEGQDTRAYSNACHDYKAVRCSQIIIVGVHWVRVQSVSIVNKVYFSVLHSEEDLQGVSDRRDILHPTKPENDALNI